MGFIEAVKQCLVKYATFSGRAARSELWWFTLALMLAGIAFGLLDLVLFGPVYDFGTSDAISLATFIPSLAVTARRLHDKDRSAWWMLLYLVPILGWIPMLYWMVTKGTEGPNRFGADPLGMVHAPEIFR